MNTPTSLDDGKVDSGILPLRLSKSAFQTHFKNLIIVRRISLYSTCSQSRIQEKSTFLFRLYLAVL
jgi:hypothetical protein